MPGQAVANVAIMVLSEPGTKAGSLRIGWEKVVSTPTGRQKATKMLCMVRKEEIKQGWLGVSTQIPWTNFRPVTVLVQNLII